jgi:ABC-type sugar transport system permease subunit
MAQLRTVAPRLRFRPSQWSPWFYVFLAPFLILFAVFLLFPIGDTLLLSLQQKNGLGVAGTFVGLENYAALLGDPRFLTAARNTIVLAVASLFVLLPCAFALALALNSRRVWGHGGLRLLFFMPAATSAVVAAMIFLVILEEQVGVINTVIDYRIPWLTSSTLILPSVFMVIFWKWTGYNSLYFLAGLQTIEPELVEQAQVDGATFRQIVRHIYLPLLKPIMLVVAILAIIGSAQLFAEPWLITKGTGGPGQGGLTMAMLIYDVAFRQLRFGYGAAIAYMLVIGVVASSLVAYAVLRTPRQ